MQSIYRLLLAATLLVATPAQAQRLLLGLKGGATISNGIGADAKSSSLRFGAHGGGLLRVKITQHLALQAEGLYAQRGDNSSGYGPSIGNRLDYISIPVLAQYHWDDVFFEAGPYFSQLRSATPVVAQLTPVGTAAFRTHDAGFAVGFGYQDSTGITVGWRYNGSLNNVFRRVDLDGSNQVQLRNSSVEFYLGYLFRPIDAVRSTSRLAVGTAKLVFIKTPILLFKGSKFLFYTAPTKLVRSIGQIGRSRPVAPEQVPGTTAPAPGVPAPGVAPKKAP